MTDLASYVGYDIFICELKQAVNVYVLASVVVSMLIGLYGQCILVAYTRLKVHSWAYIMFRGLG